MGTSLHRVIGVLSITLAVGAATGIAAAQAATAGAPPAVTPRNQPVRNIASWNLGKSNRLAVQGYDPVAYFPEGGGKATKGLETVAADSNGVIYRFASAEHRSLFVANPARYEPAYGGWCAWAMRDGEKVEVDPASFIVKDGRLFVFYNGFLADTRSKWLKGDHAAEAGAADAKWKSLSGEEPRAAGPLQQELGQKRAEFESKAPAETLAVYEQGIRDVGSSGVLASAIKVGARAPDFELPDATGKMVSLRSMLASGPVVLTWYRGGWCPYCNIQLRAYQDSMSDMSALGAKLVAVSPQTPDNSMSTAEKDGLKFAVLSDSGNKVAHEYGIAYKLPEAVAASFKGRLDLSEYNGESSNELPLAATFVIDRSGTVAYAFVDADYRNRAEPADIIAALRALPASR